MLTRTKKTARPRGRPRKFDTDAVLDRATAVFWARGFGATTLEELADAMGLVRPSIANAFGEKKDLYLLALSRFGEQVTARVGAVLASSTDLRTALTRFYYEAIEVYCAQSPALGCFVMCTAPVEAADDAEVRKVLGRVIHALDEALTARLAAAARDGELPSGADTADRARIAQAVLHSLAIRARSGTSKESLRRMAREAAAMLAPGERAAVKVQGGRAPRPTPAARP